MLVFFAESQETFSRQSGNSFGYIQFKTDSVLKSSLWTWRWQFCKLWQPSLAKNLSLEDKIWLPKFFIKGVHFRNFSSGRVDFRFDCPAGNIYRVPKLFWSINCKIIRFFSRFLILQIILWTRRIQLWQAWGKMFVKSRVSSFDVPNWF